jgi:hypothetical protein
MGSCLVTGFVELSLCCERREGEKREGRNSSEKALALCRKGHTPTHTYTEFKK